MLPLCPLEREVEASQVWTEERRETGSHNYPHTGRIARLSLDDKPLQTKYIINQHSNYTYVIIQKIQGIWSLWIDGIRQNEERGIITTFKTDTPQRASGGYNAYTGFVAKENAVPGPVVVMCLLEEGQNPPEVVDVDFIQVVTVDGTPNLPETVSTRQLKPTMTDLPDAHTLILPFPAVYTHDPYIEIDDPTAAKKQRAALFGGFYSALFSLLINLYFGSGALYLLGTYALTPLVPMITVLGFPDFFGIKDWQLTRKINRSNHKEDLFKVMNSVIFTLWGWLDLRNFITSLGIKEWLAFSTSSHETNPYYLVYDADFMSNNETPVYPFNDDPSELPKTQLKTAVKFTQWLTGSKKSRPEPQRIRFTLKQLKDSLDKICEIRGVKRNDLLTSDELNQSGYTKERVLMNWIIEPEKEEWMSKMAFTTDFFKNMLSKVKFADTKYKQARKDILSSDQNGSLGIRSGSLIEQGLDPDFLKRNSVHFEIKVTVRDSGTGYQSTKQFIIAPEKDTGIRAGWIACGFDKDVEQLRETMDSFAEKMCQAPAEEYGILHSMYSFAKKKVQKYIPGDTPGIGIKEGSERHSVGSEFGQWMAGLQRATREKLCKNARKLNSAIFRDNSPLQYLRRHMEEVVNTNIIKKGDAQLRLLPHRIRIDGGIYAPSPLSYHSTFYEVLQEGNTQRNVLVIDGAIESMRRAHRTSALTLQELVGDWERASSTRCIFFMAYEPFSKVNLDFRLAKSPDAILSFTPGPSLPPYEIMDAITSCRITERMKRLVKAINMDNYSYYKFISELAFADVLTRRLVDRLDRPPPMGYVEGAFKLTKDEVDQTKSILKRCLWTDSDYGVAGLVSRDDILFQCFPGGASAYRILDVLGAWDRKGTVSASTREVSADEYGLGESRAKLSLFPSPAVAALNAVMAAFEAPKTIENASRLPSYALQNTLAIDSLPQTLHKGLSLRVRESMASIERTILFHRGLTKALNGMGLIQCIQLQKELISLRPTLLGLYAAAERSYSDANEAFGKYVEVVTQHTQGGFPDTSPPPPTPIDAVDKIAMRNKGLRFDVDTLQYVETNTSYTPPRAYYYVAYGTGNPVSLSNNRDRLPATNFETAPVYTQHLEKAVETLIEGTLSTSLDATAFVFDSSSNPGVLRHNTITDEISHPEVIFTETIRGLVSSRTVCTTRMARLHCKTLVSELGEDMGIHIKDIDEIDAPPALSSEASIQDAISNIQVLDPSTPCNIQEPTDTKMSKAVVAALTLTLESIQANAQPVNREDIFSVLQSANAYGGTAADILTTVEDYYYTNPAQIHKLNNDSTAADIDGVPFLDDLAYEVENPPEERVNNTMIPTQGELAMTMFDSAKGLSNSLTSAIKALSTILFDGSLMLQEPWMVDVIKHTWYDIRAKGIAYVVNDALATTSHAVKAIALGMRNVFAMFGTTLPSPTTKGDDEYGYAATFAVQARFQAMMDEAGDLGSHIAGAMGPTIANIGQLFSQSICKAKSAFEFAAGGFGTKPEPPPEPPTWEEWIKNILEKTRLSMEQNIKEYAHQIRTQLEEEAAKYMRVETKTITERVDSAVDTLSPYTNIVVEFVRKEMEIISSVTQEAATAVVNMSNNTVSSAIESMSNAANRILYDASNGGIPDFFSTKGEGDAKPHEYEDMQSTLWRLWFRAERYTLPLPLIALVYSYARSLATQPIHKSSPPPLGNPKISPTPQALNMSASILNTCKAVKTLMRDRGNGKLTHRASVILWNAERIHQCLLLLLPEHSVIEISYPRRVVAARVVPFKYATDRMKLRLSEALRLAVSLHYKRLRTLALDAHSGILGQFTNGTGPSSQILPNVQLITPTYQHASMDVGVRLDHPYRAPIFEMHEKSFTNHVLSSDEDVKHYANDTMAWIKAAVKEAYGNEYLDIIEEWKADLSFKENYIREVQLQMENIDEVTRIWDDKTFERQEESDRLAEIHNSVTREAFVHSVVLSMAMTMSVVGESSCPRVIIAEARDPEIPKRYNGGKEPPTYVHVEDNINSSREYEKARRLKVSDEKKAELKSLRAKLRRAFEVDDSYYENVEDYWFKESDAVSGDESDADDDVEDRLSWMKFVRHVLPSKAEKERAGIRVNPKDTYQNNIKDILFALRTAVGQLSFSWSRSISLSEYCLAVAACR